MQVNDEMVRVAMAALGHQPTEYNAIWMRFALSAELGAMWRPISEAPKDGTRVNLCWAAFGGISEHVELGKWKASAGGWCNTYGKPFHGDPDFFGNYILDSLARKR